MLLFQIINLLDNQIFVDAPEGPLEKPVHSPNTTVDEIENEIKAMKWKKEICRSIVVRLQVLGRVAIRGGGLVHWISGEKLRTGIIGEGWG